MLIKTSNPTKNLYGLLAFVLIFSTQSLSAQDSLSRIKSVSSADFEVAQKGDIRVGISFLAGTSWAKPQVNNVEANGSSFAYGFSLYAEKYFGQNYAFVWGLAYTHTPTKITFDSAASSRTPAPAGTFFNVQYDYTLNFIEIPLSLRLKSEPFGYNRISVDIGTAPGFTIKSIANVNPAIFGSAEENTKRLVNAQDNDFDPARSSQRSDNILFFRIPIVLGANFEHQLNRTNTVTAGLRYNIGMTNLARDNQAKFQNNFLAINVGIIF